MADSEEKRDMGDESIAQLGTHGYGMGSPQNPSRMIPDIGPPRDSSDLSTTLELIHSGMDEGFHGEDIGSLVGGPKAILKSRA
jgi:hypothetical protein